MHKQCVHKRLLVLCHEYFISWYRIAVTLDSYAQAIHSSSDVSSSCRYTCCSVSSRLSASEIVTMADSQPRPKLDCRHHGIVLQTVETSVWSARCSPRFGEAVSDIPQKMGPHFVRFDTATLRADSIRLCSFDRRLLWKSIEYLMYYVRGWQISTKCMAHGSWRDVAGSPPR